MEQEDWDSTSQSLGLRISARSALGAANDANSQPLDHNNLDTALIARSAAQSAESHAFVVQGQGHPALFSHPPLVFRQSTTARFPSQQIQAVSSIRGGSRSPSDVHPNSRGRPVSPRRRSRSPTTAVRPLYRDRSQEATVPHHKGINSSHHVAGDVVSNPDEAGFPLYLVKLQKEKNKHAVCVACWLKELPCDRKWPCRECKASGDSCAYIKCFLGGGCSLDIKCPCFHQDKRLSPEDPIRKLGSSMHLITLLGLNRSFLESYDMDKMQNKMENPNSAPQIYLKLQQEIQYMLEQGKQFSGHEARKLIRESEMIPYMRDKVLKLKARHIVELVKEKK